MIVTVISVVGYGTAVAANLVSTPVGDPENPNPSPTPMSSYELTVHVAGSGDGVVTSRPAGIHCGTTCDATFDAGTKVTLTARAASNSTLRGFGARCAGKTTCSFKVDSGTSVNVVFTKQARPVSLKVGRTGHGSVTSSTRGIHCPGRCSHAYTKGSKVKLVAHAARGWRFAKWTGACSGHGACTVRLNAARRAVAHFTHQHH
jgi:hypothetical protein